MQMIHKLSRLSLLLCLAAGFSLREIQPVRAEYSTFLTELNQLEHLTDTWKKQSKAFKNYNAITEHILQLYLWTKDNFNIDNSNRAIKLLEMLKEAIAHSPDAKSTDLMVLKAAWHLIKSERMAALHVLKDIKPTEPHLQLALTKLLIGEKTPFQGIITWRLNMKNATAISEQFPSSALAQSIKAEAIFEDIMEPSPDDPRLFQAEMALLYAIKLNPDNVFSQYQKAQLLYLQGKAEEAEGAFQELLKQYPETAVLPEAIGNFYTWMKQYERSIAYYQVASQRIPDEIRIYKKIEMLYLPDSPEQAVQMYLEAIDKHPDILALSENLLRLYAEINYSPEKMEQQLVQLASVHPASFNIQQLLGHIYYINRKDEQAIKTYQTLLALNPKATEAYHKLIDIYWQQRKIEQMKSLLATALKNNPEFAEGYYWLGILNVSENKPQLAITHLHRALQIKPDFYNAKNTLGVAYRLNKDYQKAQNIFAELFRLDPRNVNIILNMGDTYYHQKKYAETERYYQLAFQIAPYNNEILFSLGNLYTDMVQYDKAIEVYQRAILLTPEDMDARNNLGNIYLQKHELRQAIGEFQRILSMTPNYATAHYNIACAYAIGHQNSIALRYLENALKLDYSLKKAAQQDPDLENIRHEKVFQDLLK